MKSEYKCSSCGKIFNRSHNRDRHENNCNQDDFVFQCLFCCQDFRTKFGLKRHLFSCKKSSKKKCNKFAYLNINGKFECLLCHKVYKNIKCLKQHLKNNCSVRKEKQYQRQLQQQIINNIQTQNNIQEQNNIQQQNNQCQIDNSVNNNTININCYMKPDTDHISLDFIVEKCIGKFIKGDANLLKHLFFNKDIPQNHSMSIKNRRDNMLNVHVEDVSGNIHKIPQSIQSTLENLIKLMTDMYNIFEPKIQKKYKHKIGLIKKMEEHLNKLMDDDQIYNNKLKRALKRLLLEFITETIEVDEDKNLQDKVDNLYCQVKTTSDTDTCDTSSIDERYQKYLDCGLTKRDIRLLQPSTGKIDAK